jgi:hypothetical protein
MVIRRRRLRHERAADPLHCPDVTLKALVRGGELKVDDLGDLAILIKRRQRMARRQRRELFGARGEGKAEIAGGNKKITAAITKAIPTIHVKNRRIPSLAFSRSDRSNSG